MIGLFGTEMVSDNAAHKGDSIGSPTRLENVLESGRDGLPAMNFVSGSIRFPVLRPEIIDHCQKGEL